MLPAIIIIIIIITDLYSAFRSEDTEALSEVTVKFVPQFALVLHLNFVRNKRHCHSRSQAPFEALNNNTTTVEQPSVWDNPGELSETSTQYTTLIVLIFLTSTPNLPSQASQSTSRV